MAFPSRGFFFIAFQSFWERQNLISRKKTFSFSNFLETLQSQIVSSKSKKFALATLLWFLWWKCTTIFLEISTENINFPTFGCKLCSFVWPEVTLKVTRLTWIYRSLKFWLKIRLLEELNFLYIFLKLTPTDSACFCQKTQGSSHWIPLGYFGALLLYIVI